MGGFSQAEERGDGQRFLIAEAEPWVGRAALIAIGQVGFCAIADEEQVAEYVDGGARLPFPKERRDRKLNEPAEEIEEGGFDRGDGVDGGALIEGLNAAASGVAIGEAVADGVEDFVEGAYG